MAICYIANILKLSQAVNDLNCLLLLKEVPEIILMAYNL